MFSELFYHFLKDVIEVALFSSIHLIFLVNPPHKISIVHSWNRQGNITLLIINSKEPEKINI